jgi:hypothetical protein
MKRTNIHVTLSAVSLSCSGHNDELSHGLQIIIRTAEFFLFFALSHGKVAKASSRVI